MRYIILLLFLSGSSWINAQWNNDFFWSDEMEYRGTNEVVGAYDGNAYVIVHNDNRSFGRKADLDLVMFDRDYREVRRLDLNKILPDNHYYMGGVATSEGILYVFFQVSKDRKVVVFGQLFSYENLAKGDVFTLASFKQKTNNAQQITNISSIENLFPYGLKLSPDRSKLLIFYHQERAGRKKETFLQYAVLSIGNRLAVVQEGNFYTDQRSDKVRIEDVDIANNGHLNYLFKTYSENKNTEFINRKPAYNYELHHLSGDSTEYIYDIRIKKEFIDNLKIGGGDNGEVYIAGNLREKPFDDIFGTYFLALDPLGYKVVEEKKTYRSRDIKDITGKDRDQLYREYEVIDVTTGDDNVYVLKQYIDEQVSVNNNVNTFNRFNRFNNGVGVRQVTWFVETVLVDAYNKQTGDFMWSQTNPRNTRCNDGFINDFAVGSTFFQGDDIYFIYNETVDNIERMRRNENLRATDVPGDRTVILICKISKDGDVTYRELPSDERFYISSLGTFYDGRYLVMLSSRSSEKRHMLHISDSDIFNF